MDIPHILAAGGIVVRHDPEPRIGIVQLRRNKAWVLPKGKLSRKESALDAARREVLEETGHEVFVHEFVGAITYHSRGKPKVVQFWRMQVAGGPARKLMRDVRAVEWLPLAEAVDRLTRARERIFLENVGPAVLRAAEEATDDKERPRVVKARRKAQRSRVAEQEVAEPAVAPAAPEPMTTAVASALSAPDVATARPEPIVTLVPAEVVNEIPLPALTSEASAAVGAVSAQRPWLQGPLLDWLFGYRKRRNG
jgi:8-oxo-dGTP diphosphatase